MPPTTNGLPADRNSETLPTASGDSGPSSALAKLLVLIRTEPPPELSHEITDLRQRHAEAVETFVRECGEAEAAGKEVFLVLKRDGCSEAELEENAVKFPRFALIRAEHETNLIRLQEAVRDALRTEAAGVRREALEAVQKGNVEMVKAWVRSLGNYAPYKHSVTSPVSEGVRGILDGIATPGETAGGECGRSRRTLTML